jgi:hypothetical protein
MREDAVFGPGKTPERKEKRWERPSVTEIEVVDVTRDGINFGADFNGFS